MSVAPSVFLRDFHTYSTDTASPDDPNEISFVKGEILDILDKQGKWWQAKKTDGTIGSKSCVPDLPPFVHSPSSCPLKLSPDHIVIGPSLYDIYLSRTLYELDVLLMALRLPSCSFLVLLSSSILSVCLVPTRPIYLLLDKMIPHGPACFCFRIPSVYNVLECINV